ncbi:hypothetical protein COCCADRAFT_91550, partial [Bipolaris zeicola 26-R-13]
GASSLPILYNLALVRRRLADRQRLPRYTLALGCMILVGTPTISTCMEHTKLAINMRV